MKTIGGDDSSSGRQLMGTTVSLQIQLVGTILSCEDSLWGRPLVRKTVGGEDR